ncbi:MULTISPECIES: multidrug/spermidine efflux SMR transporter subunit MdtJ [Pseudomonas aeruginosa group]|uniref:Spermidine export protein MdtJ n=1 Tax=Pseudomonas paraeruginosa TaxID=2994495 RepID=A0A2R3ILW9_9PSED|nr:MULTISPECIES: multidrug/spermidine efflux SMR transporter subunit MdtJ [Pseudomonas aeruginosa group]AVK02925.1 spermidine export protein MdtJ [Pseudomonas paraeruginosa]AWE91806.1 spermidine export protein MdtJ [Pseudomonas paraeruginosa]KSD80236.1 multidrug transporter subunit MdtJ [Pseudomonas aeruginosa]MCT9628395.1 SMR family transporter [Pseudomonas aeruginosa]MCW8027862.1 SMR family transporter [Pseudomonas aeruginosa]
MRSWIYLLLAIGAEVIGTTSMKLAAIHAPVAGLLLMYGMIGLSYFFLALAVKRVPVGVAYALWEGIGIVLITAVSVAWLGESIGLYKAVGLGVMIAGILLIKSGTHNGEASRTKAPGEAATC